MANRFKCYTQLRYEDAPDYNVIQYDDGSDLDGIYTREVPCSAIFYAEAFLTKTYFGLAVQVFETTLAGVFWYCTTHVTEETTRHMAAYAALPLTIGNALKILQVGISAVTGRDDGIVPTLRDIIYILINLVHFSLPLMLCFYSFQIMYSVVRNKEMHKYFSHIHALLLLLIAVPIVLNTLYVKDNNVFQTYVLLKTCLFYLACGCHTAKLLFGVVLILVAFLMSKPPESGSPSNSAKGKSLWTFVFSIVSVLPGAFLMYGLWSDFAVYHRLTDDMSVYVTFGETKSEDLYVVVFNYMSGTILFGMIMLLLPAYRKIFFCGCGKEND